jgi:hypothetical protein
MFQEQFDLLFDQLKLTHSENQRIYEENLILANFIKDFMKKENKTMDTLKKIILDQQATITVLEKRINQQSENLSIVIENVKEHLLEYANDKFDQEESLGEFPTYKKRNNNDNN